MDFRTGISNLPTILFPDEGTTVSGYVDLIRDVPFQPPIVPTEQVSTASLPSAISASWSRIAQANMTVWMYAKLVRLAAQPPGWRGPGSLALRPLSLKNFLEFWGMVRDSAEEPELALAPDGTLHAEWYKSARQRLDVRFAHPKILFGLFTGNSVLEGADNLKTVAQILKLHHAEPLSWSSR